jgi:hypothetical protein
MFTANLPTLVPPNFCTSHLELGSILFWCKFGGVRGGDDDKDDADDEGELEDDPDIFGA